MATSNQKMREALKQIYDYAWAHGVWEIESMAKAALAEPQRNCEVGTAEEQFIRWENLCESYGGQCSKCKFYTSCDLSAKCFATWAQMPYKKEGAK